MSEWFVFGDGGDHVGPVTTELLARGIAAGRVPEQAQVARGAPVDWQPALSVPELVAALEALRGEPDLPPLVPEDPSTSPDMTELMLRDDELKEAIERARSKPMSSGPPRAPLAPKIPSVPPPPPNARISNPAMPAAGRAPMPSTPPPPAAPPPGALPPVAPPPMAAPPPAMAPPPPPMAGPHGTQVASYPPAPPPAMPLPISAPPGPFGQSQPPPAHPTAPPASLQEPKKEEKKDAPKPPAIDPKVALLLPLGIFGVFVFLSILVTVYALITKPWAAIDAKDGTSISTSTTTSTSTSTSK